MRFEQKYSSSKGNLYLVTADSGKRLLLECGVRWPLIEKSLNYDLKNIVGCLLTHAHGDHSFATVSVKRAGIPIYASQETWDALEITQEDRMRRIVADKTLIHNFGKDLDVFCFTLEHDAEGCLGFIVRDRDEYLFFVPDTSNITYKFPYPFSIIAIECSYDKAILQARVDRGDIEESVAKRLLTAHLEKQNTIRYLAEFCNLSRCREIHLLHCSKGNLNIEATRVEISKRFMIETIASEK